MSTRRSTSASAVASLGSDDLQLGYMTTIAADGRTVVVATDANVTASPVGAATGAVLTPASPGQTLDVLEVGRLEPIEAPFVGVGNATDYAARDALGRIVRQASFASNVVGVCGKDGSVLFLPVLGAIQGGGGGGGAGFLSGFVDGTVTAAGQVLTTANDTVDPTKMTRATTASRKRGFLVTGITITVPVLGFVLYAVPGATVAASLLGFSPTGTTSWAVVDDSGNVVRKTLPDANDVVVGEVNERGNLYFWESIRPNSEIVVTQAPFFADNTGVTDASDALRAAFAAAPFSGIGLNYSCRPCLLSKGMYLLNKPVNIQQRALRVHGEGDFATSIRVANYVGPAFYVSGQHGTFPVQPNVMGGRQALIFKHELAPRDEHWLLLSDDGAGTWYHGKSSMCVQYKGIVNTTTDAGISFFIASFGRRATDDTAWGYGECFGCGFSGSGNGTAALRNTILFTLTTTSGIKSVYSATGSLVPNDSTVHEIEWNWSSGTMRIFIDGVQQSLLNSSGGADAGALAGTLVQHSFESTMMGTVQQLFTVNREFYSVDHRCASIRLSDIARNTSGYTPNTTARYANDSNTMLGICMANASDADDLDGIFVRGLNRQTAAGTGTGQAYFPMRRDNVATDLGTYDVVIEDLFITNLYGTGIQVNASPSTTVRRVEMAAQVGLGLDYNCFFSKVEDVKVVGLNLTRIGFRGVAALNTVSFANLTAQGFDYGFVAAGAADIAFNGTVFLVASKKAAAVFILAGAVNAAGCDFVVTDENSGSAVPDMVLFLSAIDTATFVNVAVTQIVSANAPVVTFSGTGQFGPTRIIFMNPDWGAHSSSTGTLKFLPSCIGTVDVYSPSETTGVARFRPTFSPPNAMAVTFHPDVESGTRSIALADADRTITREEHLQCLFEFTGALTANRTITMPAQKNGRRVVTNSTTGGFNLLVKLAGGAVSHTVVPNATATFWVNNAGTELVRST